MTEGDKDKSEKPTSHRVKEARERGNVPRSAELTSVITLTVFSVAVMAGLGRIGFVAMDGMRRAMSIAGAAPTLGPGLTHALQGAFEPLWQGLLPPVFAMMIAAVVANLVQTGPMLSTFPLKPDASRLNPVKGFKKIASLRTAWDAARLLVKLALLVGVACILAASMWPRLLAAGMASPFGLPAVFAMVYGKVTTWFLVVMGLVAVIDFLYTRREYMGKLKMSRREVRDEHKRHDGDPAVRSRRKRFARELLAQVKALGRVPQADVVITNPTHYAVALRYRTSHMLAPVVIAKGAGWLSARIRRLAAHSGVPVMRTPELTRALFRECGIDEPIPESRYVDVGVVYRWVMGRPGHKVRS
jgi:flagellar biosynthetic protein FlhB